MSGVSTFPALRSEAGLSRYLKQIHGFPLLTADEEAMYARRLRDCGDREAAFRLVTSHLRLAAKIALTYRRYGLPIVDLISEANVGLMLAVKRFDPEKGSRLATYATWWIRASVQEFILRSWSLVKVGTTAAQKKLFFNLRKLKSRLGAQDETELTPSQVQYVCDHLQVQPTEVINMNSRLRGDLSLSAPPNGNAEGDDWQDRLADPAPDPETLLSEAEDRERKADAVAKALGTLSDRERTIIERRFLTEQPSTLDELAGLFRISRERIRQIEQRALQRIKARMCAQLADLSPALAGSP
ncbi:RNA polymerase sigma factor RpoH [Bradyrhizobium diazoefficiens]|uniref:RNA polymerase sigma factor RpoH n=1 Tax=Bradyrhizobium diazoefficiens TaxID=1355477 RepID=UPI00190C5C18|nr:RNA polymerase sigma factor RpoH [Bradyrhizobium diazoefficiens]QQO11859.1 RNA polymerase sigma factor RpoH [Bradyrhizobium diazoefficiens]